VRDEKGEQAMWLLRACPRCHGDLALNADSHAAFLECLQCGHVLSLEQERTLGVRACRTGITHRASTQRGLPNRLRELEAVAP
jgi:hypothetical protein